MFANLNYRYAYDTKGLMSSCTESVVALYVRDHHVDSTYYIHTDHLGSYYAITKENKQVRQRNTFDVWGNNVGTANFTLTRRGFTGHEHYPQFKIINMNGRLYDPVIGRFFSPDKYVANSTFTQDFNRYSYARNNPLMYTDPSGEFPFLAAIVGGMVMSGLSYLFGVAATGDFNANVNWGVLPLPH